MSAPTIWNADETKVDLSGDPNDIYPAHCFYRRAVKRLNGADLVALSSAPKIILRAVAGAEHIVQDVYIDFVINSGAPVTGSDLQLRYGGANGEVVADVLPFATISAAATNKTWRLRPTNACRFNRPIVIETTGVAWNLTDCVVFVTVNFEMRQLK